MFQMCNIFESKLAGGKTCERHLQHVFKQMKTSNKEWLSLQLNNSPNYRNIKYIAKKGFLALFSIYAKLV